LQLSDEDFLEDTYTNIKIKMSNEGTLNNYVKILANAFELPGCTPMDYAIGIPETTNQEQEGPPC